MFELVRLMASSLEHFLAEKILLNFISWSYSVRMFDFMFLNWRYPWNTCLTVYFDAKFRIIFLISVPSRSASLYFPTTQEICYHLKLPVYTVIVQFLDCNLLAWYQQRSSDTVNYGNLLYEVHAVQQTIKYNNKI